MTFNSNGSILAIGSEDGCLYLYNTKEKFSLIRKINVHKSGVTNIDFSVDGNYIMSVDDTKRIKYTETLTGITVFLSFLVFFIPGHTFSFW